MSISVKSMNDPTPLVVSVRQEHAVAAARRAVVRAAEEVGLDSIAVYHLATAVTELATNLVVHAERGGTIGIVPLPDGIEVQAVDDGPGIADVELALTDGYSSAGGLGIGLPGARRLVDQFAIESAPRVGTRVVLRQWCRRAVVPVAIGQSCRPAP